MHALPIAAVGTWASKAAGKVLDLHQQSGRGNCDWSRVSAAIWQLFSRPQSGQSVGSGPGEAERLVRDDNFGRPGVMLAFGVLGISAKLSALTGYDIDPEIRILTDREVEVCAPDFLALIGDIQVANEIGRDEHYGLMIQLESGVVGVVDFEVNRYRFVRPIRRLAVRGFQQDFADVFGALAVGRR